MKDINVISQNSLFTIIEIIIIDEELVQYTIIIYRR